METSTSAHPIWIIGLIFAAVVAICLGVAVGMFLVIGIAMGGDSSGQGYAAWATAAFIAYPVIALAIIIASVVWGIVASNDNRRVLAMIFIALAVPLAAGVALGLTSIGIAIA